MGSQFDTYTVPSNGIRFSISDMSPPNSRTMPTIYQDRSGISLYDAQYSTGKKAPIPFTVIQEVLAALIRFKSSCHDFGVLDSNIRVVATEATRNATNRDDLLGTIKQKTGWTVQLLAKEEEGRLGAMGIASSVDDLKGICMDMGGGSVQLTWVVKRPTGDIEMGPSVSFPYGAAALLAELSTREQVGLQEEVCMRLQNAIEKELGIPQWLWEEAKCNNGFNVYLSGGGFRGWGQLLMSRARTQPYPIPIINGYRVSKVEFFPNISTPLDGSKSHRISTRRASQVPAVQLLLGAMEKAQLPVSHATFAQGGVREGLLYEGLPPPIRAENALVAATRPYAPPSATAFYQLLDCFTLVTAPLRIATINLLYTHGPITKDIRAAAALRSTTTGILASANGLDHIERGMLALILCERWDADLPDTDTGLLNSMIEVCGPYPSWCAAFMGRLAKGIASLYPAGLVGQGGQKVSLETVFPGAIQVSGSGSPAMAESCHLKITLLSQDVGVVGLVNDWAKDLSKLGKKKHWHNGIKGMSVHIEVVPARTS